MTLYSFVSRRFFTACSLDVNTAKFVDSSIIHCGNLAPDCPRGIVLLKVPDGSMMSFRADDKSKCRFWTVFGVLRCLFWKGDWWSSRIIPLTLSLSVMFLMQGFSVFSKHFQSRPWQPFWNTLSNALKLRYMILLYVYNHCAKAQIDCSECVQYPVWRSTSSPRGPFPEDDDGERWRNPLCPRD